MDVFCREVKPFAPLILQEIRFWLTIMREHAIFICLGLPGEETELKQEAQRFQRAFECLEKDFCEVSGGEDFSCFIAMACNLVNKFLGFNRHILYCLLECKLPCGCLYPLMLDHMSREALYFQKLLEKFCDGDMPYQIDAIIGETLFWLKITNDHIRLDRQLFDPSERSLDSKMQELAGEFDELRLQAADYGSMLWHYQPTNGFIRFECDVNDAALRACSFQKAAENMVKNCSVVSQLQPLMAEHFRREAEHFVDIIELIRRMLLNCDK